jgi:hypothetical protein
MGVLFYAGAGIAVTCNLVPEPCCTHSMQLAQLRLQLTCNALHACNVFTLLLARRCM